MGTETFGDTILEHKADNRTARELIEAVLARRGTTDHHVREMHDAGILDMVFDNTATGAKVGSIREGLGFNQTISGIHPRTMYIDYSRTFDARLHDLQEWVERHVHRRGIFVDFDPVRTWAKEYPVIRTNGKSKFTADTVRLHYPMSDLRFGEELAHRKLVLADVDQFIGFIWTHYRVLREKTQAVYIQDPKDRYKKLGMRWANLNYNDPEFFRDKFCGGGLLVVHQQ